MKFFLTFLILLASGVSLTTYTQNIPKNADLTEFRSRVNLGNLNSGDVITFDIKFPRLTGTTPTQYRIAIMDSTPTTLNPQPSGFNTTTTLGNHTYTWTVGTTGTYYSDVSYSGSLLTVVPYYMTVTNSNGGIITNYSHVLTTTPLYVTYLASTSDITFTTTGTGNFFSFSSLTSYDNFSRAAYLGNTPTQTGVAPGYYFFWKSPSSAETITFQSDPYPCPYDPAYPDIFKTFGPCLDYVAPTPSSSSSSDSSGSEMESWKIAVITVFSVIGVAAIVIVIVLVVKKTAATSSAATAGAT